MIKAKKNKINELILFNVAKLRLVTTFSAHSYNSFLATRPVCIQGARKCRARFECVANQDLDCLA